MSVSALGTPTLLALRRPFPTPRAPRSSSSSSSPASPAYPVTSTAADSGDQSALPGDPSLVIHTNVRLGGRKLKLMKILSTAVATCLCTPEENVVVACLDHLDLIWGGEDTPCALW
jgi:phenylpyruvate tautomerase